MALFHDDILTSIEHGVESVLMLDGGERSVAVRMASDGIVFAHGTPVEAQDATRTKIVEAISEAYVKLGAEGSVTVRYRTRRAADAARSLELGSTWRGKVDVGAAVVRALSGGTRI